MRFCATFLLLDYIDLYNEVFICWVHLLHLHKHTRFSRSASRYGICINFSIDKILLVVFLDRCVLSWDGYVCASEHRWTAASHQAVFGIQEMILFPEKFKILLYPGTGLHPDSDIRMQKANNSITVALTQIILTEINPGL